MTACEDSDPLERGRRARHRTASPDEFCGYYYPVLSRYLKSQTTDTGLAEDVTADALIAALDHWDHLLTCERPDSWLFKVAIRKLRQLESRARERCSLGEDLASAEGDLRVAAALDTWVEDHIDLVSALRSLPRRQCEVIGLHFLGGYTLHETAEILDVTDGTVKKHLNRGLETLRQVLGAAGARRSRSVEA